MLLFVNQDKLYISVNNVMISFNILLNSIATNLII